MIILSTNDVAGEKHEVSGLEQTSFRLDVKVSDMPGCFELRQSSTTNSTELDSWSILIGVVDQAKGASVVLQLVSAIVAVNERQSFYCTECWYGVVS